MSGIRKPVRRRRSDLSCIGRYLLALLVSLPLLLKPPSAEAAKWNFVFMSDTQDPAWGPWMNTNIMTELALAITNEQPAFVLFGGDQANYAQPAVPPTWTNIMAPIYAAGIPIYAVLGNHDFYEIPGFVDAFGPTHPDNGPSGDVDLTYAVTHENALVLALGAFNPTNTYRVNQAWVDSVLATNEQLHVFAFSHPPAFKLIHRDCLGTHPAQRDALWRSLARAGCRMYFCGHDHVYDHTRLDDGDGNPDNDLHQFIAGTGGSAFYPDSVYDGANGMWTPVRIQHEVDYGYLLVEVDGDVVTTRWKRRIAPFVFEPSADVFSYVARRPHLLRVRPSQERLTLVWNTPAILQASPELSGGWTNIPSATSPYVIDRAQHQRLFFRLAAP